MSRNDSAIDASNSNEPAIWKPSRALRIGGMVLLAIVLGLAFLGHFSPDMQLQWENLMALCGF